MSRLNRFMRQERDTSHLYRYTYILIFRLSFSQSYFFLPQQDHQLQFLFLLDISSTPVVNSKTLYHNQRQVALLKSNSKLLRKSLRRTASANKSAVLRACYVTSHLCLMPETGRKPDMQSLLHDAAHLDCQPLLNATLSYRKGKSPDKRLFP